MHYPSLVKPLMILAGAAILLIAMHLAASFLVPILLALFFATLLTPLFRWLKRKRIPGGLALLLTLVFMLAVGIFLVLLVGNSLSALTSELTAYSEQLSQRQAELAAQSAGTLDLSQLLSTMGLEGLAGVLSFVVSAVLPIIKNALVILLVTAFTLAESPAFIARIRESFGPDHFLPQNLTSLASLMIGYFGLRALVNLVTATATGLMLWLLGIEYAVLWAVLTFFLSFIPYIGAFTAALPPIVLAFAQGGLGLAVLVGLLIVVINAVAENIVAPMVMGRGLSISPTVVFLSFIFWMFILGGSGAFIAMPLTLGVILFMRSFEETRKLAAAVIVVHEDKRGTNQEGVTA